MGGGSSFSAILRITAFLSAIWGVGKGAKMLGLSTIAFEIVVGLILSPELVGLMPAVYAECQHKDDYQCEHKHVEEAIQQGHSSRLYYLLEHHDLCTDELNAWAALSETFYEDSAAPVGEAAEEGGEGEGEAAAEEEGEGEEAELVEEEAGEHHAVHGFNIQPCYNGTVPSELVETCAKFEELVECAENECEKEIDNLCTGEPNVFTMIGHAGVSLMVFESGMHFDFEKGARVGVGACLVAVVGTILPIVAGLGMTWLFGYPVFPDGLAVGVALTPTSPVVALKLLMEAKQLQKDFGQAVITAAFVDDVLSLVAFNILFATTTGEFSIVTVVIKPVIGVLFMCVGGYMGLRFWPKVVPRFLAKFPAQPVEGHKNRQDEALLALVFILLIGYACFTWALGTHLWGCFVAGMSFACIHHVHHLWESQLKRITMWMLRIFFSCTVAFAIPFDELLSFEAFWQGALMSLVTCVFTKVFCALFMGDARWVIGWAMVGRAEFAFLIAEMSKSSGIVTDKMFAVMIWALLWATIVTPFCFKKVLVRYLEKTAAKEEQELPPDDGEDGQNWLTGSKSISSVPNFPLWQGGKNHSIQGGFKWVPCMLTSLRFQIVYPKISPDCNAADTKPIYKLMHENGLIVTSMEQKCDQEHALATFQVQPHDGKPMEESYLEFLQRELFGKLQGMGAFIVFSPPAAAWQNPCKLAALHVYAKLTEVPAAGEAVSTICNITKQLSNHEFSIMRVGLELQGTSCVSKLVIAHPCEDSHMSEESVWYSLGQKLFPTIWLRQTSPAVATNEVPDITPEQLHHIKRAIEESSDAKLVTIVEPLSQAYDPLGMVSHDAETLALGQKPPLRPETVSSFEIRLNSDPVAKLNDLFAGLLEVIRSHDLGLLSAQVDESADCKVRMMILSQDKALTDSYLEGFLTDLTTACAKYVRTGQIELSGSDITKKKVRCMGERKLAEVAAGPSTPNISVSACWPLQGKSADVAEVEKPVASEPNLPKTEKKADQDSGEKSTTDSTTSTAAAADAQVVRGRVVQCLAPVLPCHPTEKGLRPRIAAPPSATPTCWFKTKDAHQV